MDDTMRRLKEGRDRRDVDCESDEGAVGVESAGFSFMHMSGEDESGGGVRRWCATMAGGRWAGTELGRLGSSSSLANRWRMFSTRWTNRPKISGDSCYSQPPSDHVRNAI